MAEQSEHLNDAVQRLAALAEEEAKRLNHNWIGTEHLLLGLLRDFGGVGARLLRRLGMDLEETRAAVETLLGRGIAAVPGPIGLAPRAKQVLELAVEEAKSVQQNLAGPEHLLLAMLHSHDASPPGRGVAALILEGFGVTAEHVQLELPKVLAEEEPALERPSQMEGVGDSEGAKHSVANWRDERRRQGRRYSLVLPEDLFEQVERLAERQNTSVVELLRRFTRLGLLATQLQERPDAALIIREGGTERQVLLL
jgi:ATP-dependent Clp protease ATP-binding subunit ClpA